MHSRSRLLSPEPCFDSQLFLEFFSTEDHLYALQSIKLRKLVDGVLFQAGRHRHRLDRGSDSIIVDNDIQVPLQCKKRRGRQEDEEDDDEHSTHNGKQRRAARREEAVQELESLQLTATRYGLLLNELVHNGPRMLSSVTRMLELVLTFDTYRMDDVMSDVILFVVRIAVRVESSASLLLQRQEGYQDPALKLLPQQERELSIQLHKLRLQMRSRMVPVLRQWLRNAELPKEEQAGGEDEGTNMLDSDFGRNLTQRCNVHAHLVYLHNNILPHLLTGDTVSLVLSSFFHCIANHVDGMDLAVELPLVFATMHQLRPLLVGWLDAGSRPAFDLCRVLNAVYQAATQSDETHDWARLSESSNRGRYVVLRQQQSEDEEMVAIVSEHNKNVVAELNLQVLQVAEAGAAIKPLPEKLRADTTIRSALTNINSIQVSVDSLCKRMARFHVHGRNCYIESWDADNVKTRLERLNSKEESRARAKLKGATVDLGDDDAKEEAAFLAAVRNFIVDTKLEPVFTRMLRSRVDQLSPHEMWAFDLFDTVLVPQSMIDKDVFAPSAKARSNSYRQSDNDNAMLTWFLPSSIPQNCDVAMCVGVMQKVKPITETVNGEERGGTHKDRYCERMYEAYAYRLQKIVLVFQMVSYGREYTRTLVYCSNNNLSMHHFPKLKKKDSGEHSDETIRAASVATQSNDRWHMKQAAQEALGRVQGMSKLIATELVKKSSCIIERKPPTLQGVGVSGWPARSGETERFVPRHMLDGLLPQVLLDSYHFYRSQPTASASPSDITQFEIYGYPIKQDETSRHVLVLSVDSEKLTAFGGQVGLCGVLEKRFLDHPEHDLFLLNFLAAPLHTELATVASTLLRLESPSHVLMWSLMAKRVKRHEKPGSWEGEYAVDLVELPRLQLSFRSRSFVNEKNGEKSGERRQMMQSIEMPHLHVYQPEGAAWPAELARLFEGIPHGTLMQSETQQLFMVVPNFRLVMAEGKLAPSRHDKEWEKRTTAPYFLYEVHVSKQFLLTSSLTSALYLCVCRFLVGDYLACFELADSIATDEDLSEQELQIFALFATRRNRHPDASACLCKIAIATSHSPVEFPCPLAMHARIYLSLLSHVSAICRLTDRQEHQLMNIIHQQERKEVIVHVVLKEADAQIVETASAEADKARKSTKEEREALAAKAGRSQTKRTQAKVIAELHKSIQTAVVDDEKIPLYEREIPTLIINWQKSKSQEIDGFSLAVLHNRRLQLALKHETANRTHIAAPGSSAAASSHHFLTSHAAVAQRRTEMGEESWRVSPHLTGSMYTLNRSQAFLDATPDAWEELVIKYEYKLEITNDMLIEILTMLHQRFEYLEGGYMKRGFLFLYDLFTGALRCEVTINGETLDQHVFATIISGFYQDIAPIDSKAPKREQSVLPDVVAILIRNPQLCKEGHKPLMPRLKTENYDSGQYDWRARPLEGETGGALLPLAELLQNLQTFLKQQREGNSVDFPGYTEKPTPSFSVDANTVERGLLKRSANGSKVANSNRGSRIFRKADMSVLAPILRKVDLGHLLKDSETVLPLDFSRDPLALSDFTCLEDVQSSVRSEQTFGYAIDKHERVVRHPMASAVVKRLVEDIGTFSAQNKGGKEYRLLSMGTGLQAVMDALETVLHRPSSKESEVRAASAAAATALEEADTLVGRLHVALDEAQMMELAKVSNAIELLSRVANHVDVPAPGSAGADEALLRELYQFGLLQSAGQEVQIKFGFMVTSLLSEHDADDWRALNPFLDDWVQRELMELVATMLLHASSISHLSLLSECHRAVTHASNQVQYSLMG